MFRSHLCGVIPRQEFADFALLVSIDDCRQRGVQIGLRIDGIEFAGFDQRSDCRPVLRPGIMPGKEGVLSVQGNWPDGSLYSVVVDLDTTVGQEELQR